MSQCEWSFAIVKKKAFQSDAYRPFGNRTFQWPLTDVTLGISHLNFPHCEWVGGVSSDDSQMSVVPVRSTASLLMVTVEQRDVCENITSMCNCKHFDWINSESSLTARCPCCRWMREFNDFKIIVFSHALLRCEEQNKFNKWNTSNGDGTWNPCTVAALVFALSCLDNWANLTLLVRVRLQRF